MLLPKTKTLDDLIEELTALREALGGDTPCYIFDYEDACNKALKLHITQAFYTEDGGTELPLQVSPLAKCPATQEVEEYGSRMTRIGDMREVQCNAVNSCAISESGFLDSTVRSYSIESMRSRSVRTLQRSALAICT